MNFRQLAAPSAAALAVVLGGTCIVSNWQRWSATIDEPNHIATGLEWWEHGRFHLWTETPPLARAAVALGPWLAGAHLGAAEAVAKLQPFDSYTVGLDVLHRDGKYERNLAQARAGVLPFYLLALVFLAVMVCGRSRSFAAVAVAIGLAATWPPFVAHAALATTDVAFAAMFMAAAWSLLALIERSAEGVRPWIVCGAMVGLALLTKLLALIFLPLTFVTLWMAAPAKHKARSRSVASVGACTLALLVVTALVVWAGYRFSVGLITDLPQQMLGGPILRPPGSRGWLEQALANSALPAPEFWHGVLAARAHAEGGHHSYFFGRESSRGFALSYLSAIALKTPVSGLIALLFGLVMLAVHRRDERLWVYRGMFLSGAAILIALSCNPVHLGVRHALVVYLLWAGAAAGGWTVAFRSCRRRPLPALCAALVFGQAATLAAETPRLVSYFNLFAGSQPGRLLGDADLDWGQDILPVTREIQRRGIQHAYVSLSGDGARLCDRFGAHLEALPPGRPVRGWIAISQQHLWNRHPMFRLKNPCDGSSFDFSRDVPHPFAWLRARTPVGWSGQGVLLFHIEDR